MNDRMKDFIISRDDFEIDEEGERIMEIDPVVKDAEVMLKSACLFMEGSDQLELLQLMFSFKESVHFTGVFKVLNKKGGLERHYIKKVLRCLIEDGYRAKLIQRIAEKIGNGEIGYFDKGVDAMMSTWMIRSTNQPEQE